MLAHAHDVIQVQGLCVVGTPMGAFQYVREYVRSKCGTICNDVEQMRVCSDPLISYAPFTLTKKVRKGVKSVKPETMTPIVCTICLAYTTAIMNRT